MNATEILPETREKLLDLISIIEKVSDAEWDMDLWAEETSCGTVGCAAYHYVKARPDCELKMDLSDSWPSPLFGNRTGFRALALYFGLTLDQSKIIFDTSFYEGYSVTRQQVIDRIREFLGDSKD